ncbi:hypothetical protein DFH11DRAFT_1095351 [Phellopilus nigrolimitatus]|nr:hypothetical protein DFH11DRAFT_1095351 [Phellopilus nigrolimitatus]
MYFATTAISLLSLPAFAIAQLYGPAPGPAGGATSTPATTALATAATAPPDTPGFVNVDVAFQETFTFHPSNFSAPNNTVVTFFFPNAGLMHSVTQSTFEDPCTYLVANSSTGSPAGFDSGLQENVQFSITITDDQTPIWFHCKFPLHCGMGMVGAINAQTSGSNTFSAFQAAAVAIGANEQDQSSGGPVLAGVDATATAAPSNTASVSGSSGSSGSSSSASRVTATAGIVSFVGAALFMVLLA